MHPRDKNALSRMQKKTAVIPYYIQYLPSITQLKNLMITPKVTKFKYWTFSKIKQLYIKFGNN